MKCSECGIAKARYEDPRDPPLEEDECLCANCHQGALQECIDELEKELDDLKAGLNKKNKRIEDSVAINMAINLIVKAHKDDKLNGDHYEQLIVIVSRTLYQTARSK